MWSAVLRRAMSTSPPVRPSPLVGVRVIEMAGLAPAPFAGMILADFGASVVRVDRIGDADAQTHLSRGKRAIALDLKRPAAVEIMRRLVARADVLLDPFRPGVMEKLGLAPDVLMAANERLIYARLTGYGQTGAMANKAGHDANYVALSGLMSRLKRADTRPTPPINLLADFAGGGLTCAMGVVMALFERERSGRGQVIDCAMVDGAAYIGTFVYETIANAMIWPKADEAGANLLDTGFPLYDTYETADGQYIVLGCLEPRFHVPLLEKLELDVSEVMQQAFVDPSALRTRLDGIFRTRTRDQWTSLFSDMDVCFTPVLSLSEAATHEHNVARDTFSKSASGQWVPNAAPKLMSSPSPRTGSRPIAQLGQHSRAILCEFGYSDEECDRLIADGVVAAPTAASTNKAKL